MTKVLKGFARIRGRVVPIYKKHKEAIALSGELAGLATLAAPSVAQLSGKKMNEKTRSKFEIAGLSLLAGSSLTRLPFKKARVYKKVKKKL